MRQGGVFVQGISGRVSAEHCPGGGYQHRSIYTRFGDKEGLFRAIAEPVVDEFKDMFRKVQEDFHQFPEEEQRADMGQYTARHQEELLDYIYDHFDVFRLLLDGAHGTRFSCFLDELVDIEVEYTYKYMEVIGCESVKSGLVTEEFIHIIVTAYFNGMFEVVRHNMDRAAAHRYVKMLNRYHMAGFSTVFDPQPDKRLCLLVQPSHLYKS